MAVVWSWAFGAETALQMLDDMEWGVTSTSAAQITTSTADVYTYPGSPAGLRYSLRTLHQHIASTPATPFINKGVITAAIRANDNNSFWKNNSPILRVWGNTSSNSIEIRPSAPDSQPTTNCTLYVNGVASGTTFLMTFNTWYYVALVYDMSTTTWSGELYVEGVSVIPAHTQGGLVIQTSGHYASGGFCVALAGGLNGLTGQLVLYDDVDVPTAVAPIFCSRATPNADAGETGTWVPGGTGPPVDNAAATNSNPLDLATYTEETTPPSSGDNVITEVNNLATQLGIPVGAAVLGATAHTYSTGTGVTVFAGIEDSATPGFVDGATVTPTTDTTYATATTAVVVDAGSTINSRYKIT